jgi:hypothetical protein
LKKIFPIILTILLVFSGLGVSVISIEISSLYKSLNLDDFDMVIITPTKFSNELQSLIDHKNLVGVHTFMKTIEEIYQEYNGRDEAEKIKYYIYESVENMDIGYVLLIGDVDITPIRKTEVNHIWTYSEVIQVDDVITDLYYADIYDSNGNFSSWDSNDDGVFSEFYLYNFGENPGEIEVVDEVELSPDIGVGRIPCTNVDELEIVINKIITYETQSFTDWFNKLILVAVDGHPNPGNQGEMGTEQIAEIMSDFNPIKLYESLNTLKPNLINREINNGAGFLVSAAHGRHMAFANYHKFFINELNNNDKLTIIFLGGCFNAQIDASLHELLKEFGLYRLDNILQLLHINTKKLQSCIAWEFLKHENGGSIAVIGMNRKGTVLAENITAGFTGLFAIKFFESYEPGIIISDMFNKAIKSYINDSWKDYATLQMFMILGDPSLKIGGYS